MDKDKDTVNEIVIYTIKELCEFLFEHYTEEEYERLVESQFEGYIYTNQKNMETIEISILPDSVIDGIRHQYGVIDEEKLQAFFKQDDVIPDPNECWFRVGWYEVWYSAGVCKKLCGEWQ